MALNEFKNLFIEELREIFSAEMQIVEAFPAIIQATESGELIEAFNAHFEESKIQVERLRKVFQLLNVVDLGGERCEAMEGLIKECHKVISRYPQSQLRDADLIMRLQCIEHYEMAVYGTLRTFAKQLELDDEVADLFQDSLDEEGLQNKRLTKIAEGGLFTAGVNFRAVMR